MALQLLGRNDFEDFDAWKKEFDTDAETRQDAGLSVLQLWRDTANPSRVFFLLRVNDAAKAKAFMKSPQTEMLAERGGVTASEYHLLETL